MNIRELIEMLEEAEAENPNLEVTVGCEGYVNTEGLEFWITGNNMVIADGCGCYREFFEDKDQYESEFEEIRKAEGREK